MRHRDSQEEIRPGGIDTGIDDGETAGLVSRNAIAQVRPRHPDKTPIINIVEGTRRESELVDPIRPVFLRNGSWSFYACVERLIIVLRTQC